MPSHSSFCIVVKEFIKNNPNRSVSEVDDALTTASGFLIVQQTLITPAIGYRFNFGHKTNLNVGIGMNLQYRPDPGRVIWYGHSGKGPEYIVVDSPSVQPYFDFKIGIDF